MNLNLDRRKRRAVMKKVALESAAIRENLADIINRILDELLKERFELPGYTALVRLARAARTITNKKYFYRITSKLSNTQKEFIDGLLSGNNDLDEGKLGWFALKQESKKATPNNIKNFIAYTGKLKESFDLFDVDISFIPPSRLEHLREGV